MVDSQDFLVTKEVALRTGEIQYKYRTKDGRFIVDARTLSRIRFTSDEMIHGLQGIERISHEEAKTLIARNNFQMGEATDDEDVEEVEAAESEVEETEDNTSSSSLEEETEQEQEEETEE